MDKITKQIERYLSEGLTEQEAVEKRKKILQEAGRKGGLKKGQSKSRGPSEYYKELSKKALERRWNNGK
ncbi:hypothetical protein EOL73_04025 [Candidatus Saccharibacteria bacterium]|nr:hypothetical protein [Candidatus Saccharibacteria bacterium]